MKKIRDLLENDMPVCIRELNMEQNDSKKQLYKSRSVHICPDGNLELQMPQGEHGIVLIGFGIRCEIYFERDGCGYSFVGEVKERYRRENINILVIEPKTFLKKACMHGHAVL